MEAFEQQECSDHHQVKLVMQALLIHVAQPFTNGMCHELEGHQECKSDGYAHFAQMPPAQRCNCPVLYIPAKSLAMSPKPASGWLAFVLSL